MSDNRNMKALFNIGYGLYAVTSNDGKRDNALIVNSVIQLSDNPATVAVSINKSSYSHDVIKASGKMNVCCIAKSAPFSVFEAYGFRSGRDTDKFADSTPPRSENSLVYLPKYINSYFSLSVVNYIDVGTHGLFIARVEEARVISDEPTMTYSYYHESVKPKPEKKAHGYVCNVCDEDAVNAMVAQIEKEVGVIDILVNNAGIIKRIPMCEMTAAEFRQVVDVDLNAPFIVSKACIPGMIEKGHGKIINICSMMSELGRETVSAYAAAKGGLKMLTRNICSEYGSANIQCNGIGPGYIATPQTAPLRERQADGSRHPFDSFIISKTPAARWGTPEDLMGPAVFLASDASNFVNGHVLYVDGGILAYIGKQP